MWWMVSHILLLYNFYNFLQIPRMSLKVRIITMSMPLTVGLVNEYNLSITRMSQAAVPSVNYESCCIPDKRTTATGTPDVPCI